MIVSVDINNLDITALEALIKGTTDEKLLDELYEIDFKKITCVMCVQDIHRKIMQNCFVSEDLIRKFYQKYSKNKEMVNLVLLNCNTPEDLFMDILQSYKHNFKDTIFLGEDFLDNENLTDKAITLVYNLYKNKGLHLFGDCYKRLLEDDRTGADVLLDVLKNNSDSEILCIIARHRNVKIVAATE